MYPTVGEREREREAAVIIIKVVGRLFLCSCSSGGAVKGRESGYRGK